MAKQLVYLVSLLAAALLTQNVSAKTAVATFYNEGINGSITFEQESQDAPVSIAVALDGLNSQAGGYHVHSFPVNNGGSGFTFNSHATQCGSSITGGHYNPLGVQGGAGAEGVYECSQQNRTSCEAGDLSGKFGSLAGRNALDAAYLDINTGLNLFGPNSIIGRSVVIHKADKSRWVCATIFEEGVNAKVVVATFEGEVSGTISFLQNGDDESAETSILVNLHKTNDQTTGHKWHVHESRVGEDCASTGGHYNPLLVPGGEGVSGTYACSAENLEGCEVGDLYGKHGALDLTASTVYFFTDSNLPLSGVNSVSGRSIVIHAENGSGSRYVCASLGKSATATFEEEGVSGTVKFFQGAENDPVTIDVELTGLQGVAGGYHVHEFPVVDGCGADSTGPHYNPLQVIGGAGGPQGTYQCSSNNQPACEAGDLSNKFGSLATLTSASFTAQDANSGLNVLGSNSIIGRSVVIHLASDSSRWVCATIRSDNVQIEVVSEFDTNLNGVITMSQTMVDPDADTSVFVSLSREDELASLAHKWHVHESEVTDGDCASTGGHYNPEGINGGAGFTDGKYECSKFGSDYCEVGDMVGKLGALDVPVKVLYTDAKLPLSSLNSVSERSIVVHAESGGAPRFACASLVAPKETTEIPSSSEEGFSTWGIGSIVIVVALVFTYLLTSMFTKKQTEYDL